VPLGRAALRSSSVPLLRIFLAVHLESTASALWLNQSAYPATMNDGSALTELHGRTLRRSEVSAHLDAPASGGALRGARPGGIGRVQASSYCANGPDTPNPRLPCRAFRKPGISTFSL
jgi:hypothetical protein